MKILILLACLLAAAGQQQIMRVPVRLESLSYPLLALQSRTQGAVSVECQLSSTGEVTDTRIISGPKLFHAPVVANVQKWRFARLETTDSTFIVLRYEFKLEGVTEGVPKGSFVYEHPYRVTVTSEAPHLQP